MIQIAGELFLRKGKEHSVRRFHPWIFSGAIEKISSQITDGTWVKVNDNQGNVLGYGHYQHGSIAVRMLSFKKEVPDSGFWKDRLQAALQVRSNVFLPSERSNAFRLVHGEGDGLPGLVIDCYDDVAVVQAHSAGMHLDRTDIAEALKEVFDDKLSAVYYKSHGTLPGKLRDEAQDEYLLGKATVPKTINEYGNKFYVDWEIGQKTGFFLDQRENRKLLADYARGKNVLNTFCYTGGFSIYALNAGASLVHSVDVSGKAIELTRSNIQLNGFDPQAHTSYAMDVFDFMKDKRNIYDLIILDPPAFAKHRDSRHQAVRGYQRLNAEAMKIIKPGGIIFTFSCSQVVDRQLFYDTVVSSAIQSGRSIRVLHHLSQPADHPVSLFHPEGEYLKGLVLHVE